MAASALDVGIVLFLVFQSWLGWRRGFLWHAAGAVSLAAGIFLGLAAAPLLGEKVMSRFTDNTFHARVAAFILVAGLVGLALRLLCAWTEARAEEGLTEEEKQARRSQDRVLGGFFGALKGTVLALVLTAATAALWPEWTFWRESRLAPSLAHGGARLLPDGADEQLRGWLDESAGELRRDLDLKPASAAVRREEEKK